MRLRSAARLVGTAALLATGACIPLPQGHELSARRVAGRQGDDTLVADDGSWCRVPRAAFERARYGESFTCVWKVSDAPVPGGRTIPGRNPAPAGPRT